MVGLEALYAEGTEGLRRQILQKSEITLGPRTAFKKQFERIYEVRSRFIHGDTPFPLAYSESTSAVEAQGREIGEAFGLAQAMLLGSLQRLISLKQ